MMYSSDLQFCVLTMASAPHTTSTLPPKCPLPTGKTLLKPNKQKNVTPTPLPLSPTGREVRRLLHGDLAFP